MEEVLDFRVKPPKLKERIRSLFEMIFSESKKTIIFFMALLGIITTIYLLVIYIFMDNFYNNWSDDMLQYYPMMCDFIKNIRSG